uniref:Globin domain-containing protein n=1 Tax=Haplochromis burtoni TaxID=8153 RepID=A0A3Q2W112_HAPBU
MLTAYPQTKTYCSHWARFCTGEDARRQHHGVGNIDDLVGDLTNLSKLCFQAQSGPCQLHERLVILPVVAVGVVFSSFCGGLIYETGNAHTRPTSQIRCLTVYPWTQRYFGQFGNLYNAAAIASNPRVAAHGKVIMEALEKAVKDMDNIKATYAELSTLHSEKLQVDPDNFMLLGDCLTIVVASQLRKNFTPEVHAAFQKFLAVVVSSLRRQYY